MLLECGILKGTDTHREYVTLIALPLQQFLHEHAAMLRYTYIASVFLNIRILIEYVRKSLRSFGRKTLYSKQFEHILNDYVLMILLLFRDV